jgi:hypothetical protein
MDLKITCFLKQVSGPFPDHGYTNCEASPKVALMAPDHGQLLKGFIKPFLI